MSSPRTVFRMLATCAAGFSVILPASSAEPVEAGIGQLGAALEWMPVPGSAGISHLIQRTRDGRLYLTPNEAFFPKLGLTNTGRGTVPDQDELNGGNSFATIEKWDTGDAAEWGVWFDQPGEIEVRVAMKGGTSAGRFSLQLGAQKVAVPHSEATPVRMKVPTAGRHSLFLTCDDDGRGAALEWIAISGAAAKNAAVLRTRWRPAAAHTKFVSSRAPEKVRLWVIEMSAVPGTLDFYSPITTPFGYYGPTWKADGTVNSGFNFSLWSYGRGKKEPPVEQLSHMLAIGHPRATFGGFDHEGTGVKIRDWEPLQGRQGPRQALALRVEPGPTYDTYFSYFYATDEKRWRLFGVGNKHHSGKPLASLWAGSFVEVPGPPTVQRTGPYERRMRYRGWVMSADGKLSQLDRMETGDVDKQTGLTLTHRGTTEDGWFFLETGGWNYRKAVAKEWVDLKPSSAKPAGVDYLDADDIAALTSVPSEITITKLDRTQNQARVTFRVRNLGTHASATLHWDNVEGLTFADRWPNKVSLPALKEGENQFTLTGVPAGQPLCLRILLKNDEGQFWTPATMRAAAR